MCVAVPGRITEINGDLAKVNIMNNTTEVNIKLVSAKIGDYVLIHAGCVLEVMKKDVAEEILCMFQELEEDTNEDSSASER
ncbi:MAG: HypC/HybG/HupF family hydrogenase formation chaperone [Herbinix sp.]|jgi:hydrogenase expression/formation protein HypC|nr:HypC/HybG/HupF family hydrogenase formation chaperone [Herbinix sp.]